MMNSLIYSSYNSWTNLLVYGAIIILVLALLRFINQVSIKYRQQGILWKPKFLMDLAFKLRLIVEPLFSISFIILFISINIWIHGFIVLVMITILFPYLNSYFIGKFYILKGKFKIGSKIEVGEISGLIVNFNLFGLELRQGDDIYYILYNQVVKSGFVTLPNHTSTKEVNVTFIMKDEMRAKNWITDFKLFLFDNPYININRSPVIYVDYEKEVVVVKLLLHEGVHQRYLTDMFIEKGYELIH